MKNKILLPALSLASLATVSASAQTRAPADLDGDYSLTCNEATVVLGLQQFELTSSDGSVLLDTPHNTTLTLPPLPCSVEDIAAYAPEAYASCAENPGLAFLGEDLQDKLCTGLSSAVEAILAPVAQRLNGSLAVTVSEGGQLNDLLNAYAMDGDVTDLSGNTRDGNFVVSRKGRFVSISLLPALLNIPSFCGTTLAAVTQVVNGDFTREGTTAYTARYSGDISLLCQLPTDEEGVTVTTRVGLSLLTDLSGKRLLPH